MKPVIVAPLPKTTHNTRSYLLGRAWMAVSSGSAFVCSFVSSFDNSTHNYYQSIYLFIHSLAPAHPSIHSLINVQSGELVLDFHASIILISLYLGLSIRTRTRARARVRSWNLDRQ